jgi:hypothetical protein
MPNHETLEEDVRTAVEDIAREFYDYGDFLEEKGGVQQVLDDIDARSSAIETVRRTRQALEDHVADDGKATFFAGDDENSDNEYSDMTAEEAARTYAGEYFEASDGHTIWVKICTRPALLVDADWKWHKIKRDPEDPGCWENEHDWQKPYSIVGGNRETPGVVKKGCGTVTTECCIRCGCRRVTDTWATDPEDGEEALVSVSYEESFYEIPEDYVPDDGRPAPEPESDPIPIEHQKHKRGHSPDDGTEGEDPEW